MVNIESIEDDKGEVQKQLPTSTSKQTKQPEEAPVARPTIPEGFVSCTDDQLVYKKVLEEGTGAPVVPLHRAYVNLVAYYSTTGQHGLDGTKFIDSPVEEFNFMLGRAEVAKGLEMAVCQMKTGERAIIYCGATYGYSKTRLPEDVPAEALLTFDCKILRSEKEHNLHQMDITQKFEFVEQRRTIGGQLYRAGLSASAIVQYDKGLLVLDQGLQDEKEGEGLKAKNRLFVLMYMNSAACHLKLKNYPAALSSCNKALEIDKHNQKCLYRRATAYMHMSDWDESLADFSRVKEMLEKKIDERTAGGGEGKGERGGDEEEKGDDERVIASIEKNIKYIKASRAKLNIKEKAKFAGMFDKAPDSLYSDKQEAGGVTVPRLMQPGSWVTPSGWYTNMAFFTTCFSSIKFLFDALTGSCRKMGKEKKE